MFCKIAGTLMLALGIYSYSVIGFDIGTIVAFVAGTWCVLHRH